METLEHAVRDLLRGGTTKARLSDLATLGELACYYIETVVADTLCQDCPKGFELLQDVASAPALDQLDIVTLNHDTLVEQFLTSRRIAFTDGFGLPDGDVRWSEDATYDVPSRVRLFKLHGSVNWYNFLTPGRSRTAILLSKDAAIVQDGQGALIA
jgi:hypothetical protein